MNSQTPGNSCLEVKYDKELDILYVLIPGRKIAVSSEVVSPLIIDFGSADDGFDVVGFELHRAAEYLLPALPPAAADRLTVADDGAVSASVGRERIAKKLNRRRMD